MRIFANKEFYIFNLQSAETYIIPIRPNSYNILKCQKPSKVES